MDIPQNRWRERTILLVHQCGPFGSPMDTGLTHRTRHDTWDCQSGLPAYHLPSSVVFGHLMPPLRGYYKHPLEGPGIHWGGFGGQWAGIYGIIHGVHRTYVNS